MAKTEQKRTNGYADSSNAAESRASASPPSRTSPAPKAIGAGSRARHGRRDGSKKLPADVARAVQAALDKKAQDVVVLDLRNTPAFTDFFILCSGLNSRQVKAIADAVEETLRAIKMRPAHTEGYDRAEWVLMDFFSSSSTSSRRRRARSTRSNACGATPRRSKSATSRRRPKTEPAPRASRAATAR